MTEPGVCELTSDPDSLSFHMGGMKGISEESLSKVKEVLEHMCPVDIEDNLIGARWSKLLINATYSGLGTVIGGTFGDVAGWKPATKVAVRCMKECIDVARAGGVEFAPVQGKDITKLFDYSNRAKQKFAEILVPIAMKKHFGIVPSMLQDLQKGKPCEVDAINGAVSDYGRKVGCPTPMNDKVVEIIHKIEKGELKPSFDNLQYFK
jgi:2-dehydropantoate 2-reductase